MLYRLYIVYANSLPFLIFKYFPGTKQASPTDSWCLTTEEYEKWDRLYKIKAGEGIKKPIMPRSQFVTLECKDTRTVS